MWIKSSKTAKLFIDGKKHYEKLYTCSECGIMVRFVSTSRFGFGGMKKGGCWNCRKKRFSN